MSQSICFEKALSNSVLLTEVVVSQGSGLDLTKTLHLLRALGMVNSTIWPNPSSCRDSVARECSASAMAFADLFLLTISHVFAVNHAAATPSRSAMLFTKVRGTRKVTPDVIHPKTVLRKPKALYLLYNSEPKSFRECISFFLFRFTALIKYLFKSVHESHDY